MVRPDNARRFEPDHSVVNHLLSCIFEIDGDAVADNRLNLSDTPVGALGVTHEITG